MQSNHTSSGYRHIPVPITAPLPRPFIINSWDVSKYAPESRFALPPSEWRNGRPTQVYKYRIPSTIYYPTDKETPPCPTHSFIPFKRQGSVEQSYSLQELLTVARNGPTGNMLNWDQVIAIPDMQLKVDWRGYEISWCYWASPVKMDLPDDYATQAQVAQATAKIIKDFMKIAKKAVAPMFYSSEDEDAKYRIGPDLGYNQVFILGIENTYDNVFQAHLEIRQII